MSGNGQNTEKRRQQVAAWYAIQREKYQHGQLTQGEVAQLESIPGWTWEANAGKQKSATQGGTQ